MTNNKGKGDNAEPMTESSRAFFALWVVMGVGLLGIILYAIQASTLGDGLVRIGTGVTAATASMVVGGVLGFLFGIPRTFQGDQPSKRRTNEPTRTDTRFDYRANTNLEQISDWLTKILVGVGLTQLTTLPDRLQQVATYVAQGLGESPSAPAFAGSLLVVFNVCGFLLSYLWTRLYLAGEFQKADDFITLHDQVTILVRQPELDAKAITYVQRQLHPSSDNPPVLVVNLVDAIKAASLAVQAYIFSQALQVRRDNWKNHPPIITRVIPIFRALTESDAAEEHHRYWGQLGYSLKDQPDSDWKGAEAALSKAIEIRGPWQKDWSLYEFNRALCKIAQWKAEAGVPNIDGRLKKSVIDDLRVAVKGGMREIVLNDPNDRKIKEWMEAQKVSENDLA